ncbi:cytochrome c peroxidase [Sphingomonas sp. dw_22]|uniref:cytochrome-c peroxidase n=1 Tax=Sphingomonas sp. dw_22 TaxID=2721175 RepID=UPI001BD5F331|nr:cytochrome c peroxidase [Sphingomonas sp. dw_22]
MVKVLRYLGLGAASLLFVGAVLVRGQETAAVDLRRLYAGKPSEWPRPALGEGAVFEELGPLPPRRKLEGKDAALAALGRKLFNDPVLSGSGQITCASCHNPELGFGDGLRTAFGHDRQRGRRNAQSLYTVAWMHEFFWDGRARSLEEQAAGPIGNPIEMAAKPVVVLRRLKRDSAYRQAFAEVFGSRRISSELIATAIAAFERSIRPPASRWDRMLAEGPAVFTDQELLGLHLFRTKAGCANCHSGPLLSDGRYHNLGLTYYGRELEDLGRYGVTHDPADVGRFRTPSLRAVRRTGPYMHNGVFPTLAGIVNFYNAGGVEERRTQSRTDPKAPPPRRDALLKPLELTPAERAALVAFLETL